MPSEPYTREVERILHACGYGDKVYITDSYVLKAARENHRQIYEDVRSGQKYMLDLSAYDEAEWEKLALMGLMERNLFGLKSAGRKSKGIKIFLFIIAATLLSILAILLLFVLQKM